jgi:hypothetical protein
MDLLDELKEDLKHEQAYKAWQKYGKFALIGVVCIITAIIISVWFQTNQKVEREHQGDNFFQIGVNDRDSQKNMLAAHLSEIIAQKGIYYDAALFRQAAVLRSQGNVKDELEAYRQIFTNNNVEQIHRDLAEILYLSQVNDAEQTGQLARLAELSRASTLMPVAKRVLAAKYLEQEQYDKAYVLYKKLTNDVTSPEFIRVRSGEISNALEKYYSDKIIVVSAVGDNNPAKTQAN